MTAVYSNNLIKCGTNSFLQNFEKENLTLIKNFKLYTLNEIFSGIENGNKQLNFT